MLESLGLSVGLWPVDIMAIEVLHTVNGHLAIPSWAIPDMLEKSDGAVDHISSPLGVSLRSYSRLDMMRGSQGYASCHIDRPMLADIELSFMPQVVFLGYTASCCQIGLLYLASKFRPLTGALLALCLGTDAIRPTSPATVPTREDAKFLELIESLRYTLGTLSTVIQDQICAGSFPTLPRARPSSAHYLPLTTPPSSWPVLLQRIGFRCNLNMPSFQPLLWRSVMMYCEWQSLITMPNSRVAEKVK